MKIGCLQFASVKGDVNNNLSRADAVLLKANADDLDLLVLPELAFSGCQFKSLQDIYPHLEPTGSGITSLWARTIALKHGCTVVVGYPEKVDVSSKWPASPEYYNSVIVISEEGETVGGYRKSHLYGHDETWALEGGDGFFSGDIANMDVTIGISTDVTPYRFQTPWISFEFAFHILNVQSNLVIVSMSWPTSQDPKLFSREPQEPDMETLMYWMSRLEPLIHAETGEEVIIVFANRTGTDGDVVYAGTSAVLGIQDGEVKVYGILGRSDRGLLVVDTDREPYGKLVYRPQGADFSDNMHQAFYNKDERGTSVETAAPPPPPPPPPPPQQAFSPPPRPAAPKTADTASKKVASTAEQSQARPVTTSVGPSKRSRETPKLSLQTGPEIHDVSYPNIPTPTGPSPTPISRRPRISIPPADSWTQRYLDSHHDTPVVPQAKTPHIPTPHPMQFTPVASRRILGGEVRIAQSGPPTGVEGGSYEPLSSRGADSPTLSESTGFSGVNTAVSGSVSGATHPNLPSFTEIAETPDALPIATSLEQLASNYAKLREERFKKKRGRTSREEVKRQASLPRQQPDVHGLANTFGKTGLEHQPSSKSSDSNKSTDPHPSPPKDQRVAVLSQRAHSRSPALKDRQDGERAANDCRHGRSGFHAGSGQERSHRTSPKGQCAASHPRGSPSEQSRGRSRFQTPGDAVAATNSSKTESGRSKSRSTSAQAPQPVDLSQFQVIEEYTCDNCPVHGSRSNSRANEKTNEARSASSQQREQQQRYRSASARGHRSNMSTPNMKNTPQNAQPGVRRRIADLPYNAKNSDLSRPDDLTFPYIADNPRQSHGFSTAPPKNSPPDDPSNGHVHIHLHTEKKHTYESYVPARPVSSKLLPAWSTPNLDLSTPTAMLVVYDSPEFDAESRPLRGKKLQCVTKST